MGHLVGALGPLTGGWLYSATGGWSAVMIVYVGSGVFMLLGAFLMIRDRYLENQIDEAAEKTTV